MTEALMLRLEGRRLGAPWKSSPTSPSSEGLGRLRDFSALQRFALGGRHRAGSSRKGREINGQEERCWTSDWSAGRTKFYSPDDGGGVSRRQYSGGTEGRIIDALRSAAVLTLSLVAVADGEVIGRAAFSAVRVEEGAQDWFGLGPVAVRTDPQRRGLGQALIGGGLQRLAATNAGGCVVLGDTAYYGRFGFVCDPAPTNADGPPGYFQPFVLKGAAPRGTVYYYSAFSGA